MKKRLALILALALVFTLAIPALATSQTGDGTADLTGTTNIEYKVDSTYSITIPAEITVAEGSGNNILEGSGTYSLDADARIPADKRLTFAITAATNYAAVGEVEEGFKLKNNVGTNVYLPYNIWTTDNSEVALDYYFINVDPVTANDYGKSVELNVITDPFTSAGTYSDTLTITVKLIDATQP